MPFVMTGPSIVEWLVKIYNSMVESTAKRGTLCLNRVLLVN